MLESLSVRNIALIDRLNITFCPGLNVLTGETGAGKSIIVDSLMLLLGGRFNKDIIRAGTDKAFVEGVFGPEDLKRAADFLNEESIEAEEGVLTLSREVTDAGRSVSRVCGVMLPLSRYRALAKRLMDIHGQSEHQSLADQKQHLFQLDAFGNADHRALIQNMESADAQKRLTAFQKDVEEKRERLDLLRYQQQELKTADLKPGEEDELTKERDLNRHAEKITGRLKTAYAAVYDGGAAPSALELMRSAYKAMEDIAPLDDTFQTLSERLKNLYYEIEDIGLTLQSKSDDMSFDEGRLDEIEERLETIRRLSRKYGASTGDMLAKLAQIEKSLSNIENADDDELISLEKEVKKTRAAAQAAAKALSESRRALGAAFEKKIERQLSELNMEGTRFVVSLEEKELSAGGADDCAFLISPNRGEALKQLSQTASGGELSRLMLAVKSISAEQSLIPSMVFDEIDTGISGRTAQVVAEKMADIAKYRQVLCVTHLAQIAAMADSQYRVEKRFDGARTLTNVNQLDDAGREDELARMIGGADTFSDSAKTHARALLSQARAYRESLSETD